MKTIPTLIALAALLPLAACKTTEKKEPEQAAATRNNMPNPSNDVSYQSFVGRLRKAVAAHDVHVVASMMTSNFGYLLEPEGKYSGEGPGVFQYWDEKGLWDELELVLQSQFVPKGNFMVAPPEFEEQPGYTGYRAGITMVNGSWRFAYFVSG